MPFCSKQLIWTLICILFYVLTIIMNTISASGGINDSDQTELSAKYTTPITPPGWTFSIWGIIYIWQALWLLYLLFFSIKERVELAQSNILLFGTSFYISWLISCCLNIAWLVAFSFEELTVSAFLLVFTALTLYSLGYASHSYVYRAQHADSDSDDAEKEKEKVIEFPSCINDRCTLTVWKILVNNAIAFYATWVTVAMCLGIAIFLLYVAEAQAVDVVALICIGILNFALCIYWFLDFYYLRSWLIDTYAPYAMLFWALSALSTNDLPQSAKIWIFVLIGLTAITFILKIVSAVLFYRRDASERKTSYSGVGPATPQQTV